MRWVIVGAGAVGQVLALHARRAGIEVAFKVRDKSRVEGPFRLTRLGGRRADEVFDAPVFDRDDEVAAFRADLVVVTVPSDALRGPWLEPLVRSAGNADLVVMSPTGTEHLEALAGAERITRGIVAFIAYQAPLPGEPPGPRSIAYWLPPGVACPFEGPAAGKVVATLRSGGFPAKERRGLAATASYGSALMSLYVASLRAAGWKLADWYGSAELHTAGRAFAEAREALGRTSGHPPPWWTGVLTPGMVAAGMRLGARILPLPLETYLEVHFTKVGSQNRMHLEQLVERCAAAGVDAPATQSLLANPGPAAA
jgi:Ketopantoate reductase PanE/ApbA